MSHSKKIFKVVKVWLQMNTVVGTIERFVYKLERMSCPICECEGKGDNNSVNGRLILILALPHLA